MSIDYGAGGDVTVNDLYSSDKLYMRRMVRTSILSLSPKINIGRSSSCGK